MKTAKLFFNGGSQAVRLPKAFRFEGMNEVIIERDGERVILHAGPHEDREHHEEAGEASKRNLVPAT